MSARMSASMSTSMSVRGEAEKPCRMCKAMELKAETSTIYAYQGGLLRETVRDVLPSRRFMRRPSGFTIRGRRRPWADEVMEEEEPAHGAAAVAIQHH